jgi:hypothetical protein
LKAVYISIKHEDVGAGIQQASTLGGDCGAARFAIIVGALRYILRWLLGGKAELLGLMPLMTLAEPNPGDDIPILKKAADGAPNVIAERGTLITLGPMNTGCW